MQLRNNLKKQGLIDTNMAKSSGLKGSAKRVYRFTRGLASSKGAVAKDKCLGGLKRKYKKLNCNKLALTQENVW